MRTLWCTKCDAGYASVAGDSPRICPRCDQPTVWTTLAPTRTRPHAWVLTYNDRAFLKSIRVSQNT